jgi:uncharacterized protein YjeT (DUF2065 family)
MNLAPAHPTAPALACLVLSLSGVAGAQDTNDAGPDPKVVRAQIRALIAQLGRPKGWKSAARALERMGENAVEPMVEAITTDGIEASDRTLRLFGVLEAMGPAAKIGYGPLADAIPQSEPKVFLALWHTLGTLVPYSDSRASRNEAQRLLQGGIQTLTALSPEDRRKWGAEYSRFTQRAAIDPGGGLKAMIAEVKRNAMHRREVAAEVLARMGKAAVPALPALANGLRGELRKKLGNSRGRVRVRSGRSQDRQSDGFAGRAADAMIKIAPSDPRCSVAYGWRLRESRSPQERSRAALRIGSFGAAGADEVPTLIAALDDADKRVRWEVITAIGMLGATAKAAIPRLEAIVGGTAKAAAARARAALKQIRRQ